MRCVAAGNDQIDDHAAGRGLFGIHGVNRNAHFGKNWRNIGKNADGIVAAIDKIIELAEI